MSPADDRAPLAGHNGGPPLDDPLDHIPEWEDGDPYTYFRWKRAHRRAWKGQPQEIRILRSERAEAAGFTDEEYTLELLERGRHLQKGDDLEALKAAWKNRKR